MLVAVWLMLSMNFPFWRKVWDGVGGLSNDNLGFLLSLPLFVWIWLYLLLSLLAWGRLTKPVLSLMVLVSAAAGYFMNSYGIVIDYYTQALNLAPTEKGFDMDYFGSMLMHFAPEDSAQ